jgi:hypothetical protein
MRCQGSSVGIVSAYGLDDRGLIPNRGRGFTSSLCVQTGSGAHPAFCTMGTGVLSSRVKRGWGVTLTSHPRLVPRSRMSRSKTASPHLYLFTLVTTSPVSRGSSVSIVTGHGLDDQ